MDSLETFEKEQNLVFTAVTCEIPKITIGNYKMKLKDYSKGK